MKKTRNFLLITDVVTGGEWHAINRLVNFIKKTQPVNRFSLIGFGDKSISFIKLFQQIDLFKHASPNGPFGYFKKLYKDFYRIRFNIVRRFKNIDIDYFLVVDYLSALVAFSVKKKQKVIFLFHGIRSSQLKTIKDVNYRQLLTKFLERFTLFLSDVVMVPSLSTKKFILSHSFPFNIKSKIHIIPNIVTPNYYLAKHGSFDTKPKILYSGRLMVYKGILSLIKGFVMLVNDFPEAHLYIVYPSDSSDKRLEKELKKNVLKMKITKNVTFVKDPSTDKIAKYYEMCHATVLASEIENSPLSILESLACGTPVIGTETGDIPFYINKLDNNLLLGNNSPLEIYKRLKYFFSLSQSKLNKLSNKSKIIVANHNGDVSVNRFVNIINMLESE